MENTTMTTTKGGVTRERMKKGTKGQLSWLSWAVIFLIIAIIAALFGFGLIAGISITIAKWLAIIFIILFIISIIAHAVK